MAHEPVRAGPDRVFSESVVTHPSRVLLRHDDASGGGGGPVEGHEIRPRLPEDESHGDRIADLYLADVQRQLLGPRTSVPFKAELHIVRGDRVAVVKLEPPPQLELVGEAIRALRP